MKAPRGGLGQIFTEARKLTEARLAMMRQYLDAYATSDVPESGGKLTRRQFDTLLLNDEDFQRSLTERAPFMTEKEKDALSKRIEELLPTELPPEVGDIPPRPF